MDNPITREEMYLAAAAGERLNLPEPITRVEHYLKRIAESYGGGTGTGGNVDLTGYATEQWVKDQNYLTKVPEGYAKDEDIPTKPEDIGALPNTYTPPNQTAEQVGADPKGTAASAVSQHNTADDSHSDIRLELKAINDKLTAFFDSDDQTLDELSEIVAYITSNKSLIDSITTSKVSVADIINNLSTNVSNKPLSAAQGVVLKGLIDTLSNNLANYQPKGDYLTEETDPTVPTWAKEKNKPSYSKTEVGLGNVDNVKQYSATNPPPYPVTSVNGKTGAVTVDVPTVPTKVSAFTNDAGYLTEHQDISGLAKKSETVSVNAQTLTEAQKAQARQNIGARNVAEISPSTTEEELAAMYADGIRLVVINSSENLVPSAIAQNGVLFNGCGYRKEYRLTDTGGVTSLDDAVLTGYIPYIHGKTIQIIGGLHNGDDYGNYMAAYNSAFEPILVKNVRKWARESGGKETVDENNIKSFTVNTNNIPDIASAAYIRISLRPCVGRNLQVRYI